MLAAQLNSVRIVEREQTRISPGLNAFEERRPVLIR